MKIHPTQNGRGRSPLYIGLRNMVSRGSVDSPIFKMGRSHGPIQCTISVGHHRHHRVQQPRSHSPRRQPARSRSTRHQILQPARSCRPCHWVRAEAGEGGPEDHQAALPGHCARCAMPRVRPYCRENAELRAAWATPHKRSPQSISVGIPVGMVQGTGWGERAVVLPPLW